jgi:hypothetical protein
MKFHPVPRADKKLRRAAIRWSVRLKIRYVFEDRTPISHIAVQQGVLMVREPKWAK